MVYARQQIIYEDPRKHRRKDVVIFWVHWFYAGSYKPVRSVHYETLTLGLDGVE